MNRKPIPWYLSLVLAALVGPALFVGCRGAGLSAVLGIVLTLALLVVLSVLMRRRLSYTTGTNRWLLVVWIVLSLAAAYRLAHLGVFMLDAHRTQYAEAPTIRAFDDPQLQKPFAPKHNCFTCYIIAAHLADNGAENIYRRDLYRHAEVETPIHKTIGDTLTIDTYQYPPPFLLLPKLLMLGGRDFFAVRSIWFALNVLAFCTTALVLAGWLGGRSFNAYWLTLPIVLLAPNTLVTLQIGNVHFLIITLSVLGMYLLEKGRYVSGGMMLGFAVVSKLFPGVLLLYLLFRRRWNAVMITGAAMIAFCLLTLAVFGEKPFHAFLTYQLPRLANGEAFWFAREYVRAIAVNASVFGAVYRLHELGLLGGMDAAPTSGAVMLAYTGLLILIVAWTGHAHRTLPKSNSESDTNTATRLTLARVWLGLLLLGQLRSPFLPWDYANVVTLWFLALLIPPGRIGHWRAGALFLAWWIFATNLPLPFGPPTISLDLYYGLTALALVLVAGAGIVLRHGRWRVMPTVRPLTDA